MYLKFFFIAFPIFKFFICFGFFHMLGFLGLAGLPILVQDLVDAFLGGYSIIISDHIIIIFSQVGSGDVVMIGGVNIMICSISDHLLGQKIVLGLSMIYIISVQVLITVLIIIYIRAIMR